MTALTETVVVLKCSQGHSWRVSLTEHTQVASETRAAGKAACCPICGQPGASESIEIEQQSIDEKQEPPPEVPGYELLEELGRGGMAVVFRARQLKPQRLVALKILHHPTSGDASWVARFRTEAEAVAQLEHPNIVRMYEVGEAQRVSYLALEFVDGGNLAARLQGQTQEPRWTAEMIATLARAMQFAHQRGVIHRDLKPANILLQVPADAMPVVPKITDFGLAKRLDDDGQQTRTGDILGTPSYMAPEQATGVTRNIGPACDVHALGVILYEMLTGRQPYRGADVMETLRLVATADPIPPRRLDANIPRDLETICLKCLEKRPRQRYASAAELAAELQRFLNNETIRTRPAGALEKTYKWSQRHPATALALAVVFFVPLLIAIGLLSHNARISQELARTAQQRNRAEANLLETQESIDHLLREIQTGQLSNLPRSAPVRREMLEWAIGLCQQLRVQNPDNARLQLQSIRATRQTADLQRLLGRFAEAEEDYGQAIRQLSLLVDEQPREPPLVRELAAAHNNAGLLAEQMGRTAVAEKAYRRALDLWLRLGEAAPSDDVQQAHAATLSNLGRLLVQFGRTTDAEQCFEKAIELQASLVKEKPDDAQRRFALATSRINYGNLRLASGRFRVACGLIEPAQVELSELTKLKPENVEFQAALAAVENNLAAAAIALQQPQAAEQAYGRAIDRFGSLVRDFPTDVTFREQLATTQLNLALLWADTEREDDAQPLLEQARSTFAQLSDEQPDVPQFRQAISKALQQLAAQQAKHGQQLEAEVTLLDAIKLQQGLAQQFPQRAEVLSQLGLLQYDAAKLLQARKANDDAVKYFAAAVKSQQLALAPNGTALVYRLRLREHLRAFAEHWIQQGDPAAAARVVDQLATLFPGQADEQFQAAQLLAQCLPIAATVKGQEKINGQTADVFCRQRCLELLGRAVEYGFCDQQSLEQGAEFAELRGDPQFQQLVRKTADSAAGK